MIKHPSSYEIGGKCVVLLSHRRGKEENVSRRKEGGSTRAGEGSTALAFYSSVQLQVHDDEVEEGTTEVTNLEVTDELHRSSFCGVLWVKSLMGVGLRE